MTNSVMNPAVTVVMPAFNAAAYVEQALRSIVHQTFRDWVLVVINDGSTDGTGDILEAFAASDRRVRVVHQANAGVVAALNHGIMSARGAWIARMDADDVAHPLRLERQLAFLASRPDTVALGSDCVIIDGGGRELGSRRYPRSHGAILSALERRRPVLPHPSVVVSRDAVTRVGGYRERFRHAEDVDLWLRLSGVGMLASLPVALMRLRKHDTNVSLLSGGHLQRRNACLARVAHFCRRNGCVDPSLLGEREWTRFVRWAELRMTRWIDDERALAETRVRVSRGMWAEVALGARPSQMASCARAALRRVLGDGFPARLAREVQSSGWCIRRAAPSEPL